MYYIYILIKNYFFMFKFIIKKKKLKFFFKFFLLKIGLNICKKKYILNAFSKTYYDIHD